MGMQDYNSADPPTRVQTWKMLNEAWGYVTGGLTASDFASDAKLQEGHIKFVESGHTHDGTDSHSISSGSVRKKNFDLQTCNIAWGTYFQKEVSEDISNYHTYLILGGTGSISLSSGGGAPPAIDGILSGAQAIDYDGTVGRLHLSSAQLNDLDSGWSYTDLVGAIANPVLDTDELACYMMEVDTTNDRFVAYALEDPSPSTINYDYIVVMRQGGSIT